MTDPRSLTADVERSPIRRPHTAPNMLAVASGKGGVGKTWFAITLSHSLARLDRNILLFDGDLSLANVNIQLGLIPDHDLGEVFAGRVRLRAVPFPCSAGRFDVIAGSSGSGLLANSPRDTILTIGGELVKLAAAYDQVVMDLGAGVEHSVRALAGRAGICLVLVTNEPTALADAYAFIKLMLHDQPDADIRIVVNQAPSTSAGRRTYEGLLRACQQFLHAAPPLLGVIRREDRVADCIRLQTPLLTRYPECNAAADVDAIAINLMTSSP